MVGVRTVGKFALPFRPFLMYDANMRKAISVVQKKRGRGRPPKPEDERLVGSAIRLSQALTEQVDAWGEKQAPPLSRSEAIRALIEKGLKARK